MPRQNPRQRHRAGSAAPATPPAPAPVPVAKAAEKPKKPAKRAWGPNEYTNSAAGFFGKQVADNAARKGGALVGRDSEFASIGIPLMAFSLQYAYSSTVYPLGRMEMLIGESDSCKTAFLFEKMRWFLREDNAGAVYELNEARDPAELRSSIIGPEKLDDGRFVLEGPCESLEHWQRNITGLLHKFENGFKQKGGVAFPVIIGLDSITGTTNERVIANIDKLGCAQITFGQDANLLNQYAKYLFQRLYPWPFSFVCTNHIKFGQDKYGNKVMRIPGGDELRYVSTYIVLLEKRTNRNEIDRLGVAGGRKLRMKVIKSMGDHRELDVEFVWQFVNGRQYSTWDWHGATIELLDSFTGRRGEEIQDMVKFEDVNKGLRTCKCPKLGFKKSTPYDEVGRALMSNASVLTELQDYFGIKRRRPFEVGVVYSTQVAAAIAAGELEKHNASDIENVDRSHEFEDGAGRGDDEGRDEESGDEGETEIQLE